MRLPVWIVAALACALACALPAAALAQPPPPPERAEAGGAAQTVIVLPPTPPAETATQVPSLRPAQDLGDLAGKRVTRVAVLLEGNIWRDVDVPPVSSLRPGDTLTPEGARHALDEEFASGRFARGDVSAQAEDAGAAVILRLVPRKLIGRLELELHGSGLEREELLHSADLTDGGELIGADIPLIARRIERYAALHGYPSAKATLRTRDTDDPMRALVFVDVEPGAPRRVDERHVYVFGAADDAIRPLESTYGVNPGERADEPAIDQADAAFERTLRAKGWYRAVVSHDLAWVGPPGATTRQGGVGGVGGVGRVVLRVRADTGARILPRFEGNESYDADALTGALALETETDRSPSHLADKIRAFYAKRGFLDAVVTAEVRGGERDSVQLLVLHVGEGARVRVVSRSYPCLKLDVVGHLRAGGPPSTGAIGTEVDSFLEEELPGADLLVSPNPQGLSATIGSSAAAGGGAATGARPVPADLHPDATYVGDTYERAVEHVQELYRNEGFLHAVVGPVQIVRARCDPRSPPQQCVPLPLPPLPTNLCPYDPSGLPAAMDPIDPSFTCRPDPAHDVTCAPTMKLVIPVRLGPRTHLWDVAFTGVRNESETEVGAAAQAPLGEPVSTAKIEDARRRVADWYKERGYYYVDVKYALESSADSTRARVRFDIVEGEKVIVQAIVIRGLVDTRESLVRRRIALQEGQPYRASDVRKTQERIATLGVFSTVNVSLSDPYVPQANKVVIVEVAERLPQYVEVRPGFSTGEGFRGTIEYGHRNLLGYAWSVTAHVQASYLPDFLILDPGFAANYGPLSTLDRIATRDTLTFAWPEMGLGPTVRSQLDGIYVRDLERDFTLFKAAVVGTFVWRPVREVVVSVSASYEHNDVNLFDTSVNGETIAEYLAMNPDNPGLAQLLRVPDGDSYAFSQRILATWDRRDNPFNAHRGTYISVGVEHVDSFPISGTTADPTQQYQSHFLRLTQTVAGYVPFSSTVSLAAEVRLGEIVNVSPCTTPFAPAFTTTVPYCTYPDRLFFMGGFDSMRGWAQDSFIPQEYRNQIATGAIQCVDQSNCTGVPIRGGNLMINPRLELRFPIRGPLLGALFSDFGNLWTNPHDVLTDGLKFRTDVGAGVRLDTPVGPLVFDYGVNVLRHSYEDLGAFHFAIGLY